MVILPLQTARVSDALRAGIATQTVSQTQNDLLTVEQQLSTGKRVNRPSDDPSATAVIQQLTQTLDNRAQYKANLSRGSDQLNQVDAQLGDLSGLLTQAQSIAHQNVGTATSADARKSAAAVVDGVYDQVLSLANTSYEGAYLFGGDKANAAPYKATDAGAQFVGSNGTLSNRFGEYTSLDFQVSATSVFGGQSASVSATADLDPALRATDPLSTLTGATQTGVHPGQVLVSNGTTTATVDLSAAQTLGDVVAGINAAGLAGVTASLTGGGITVAAGPAASVAINDAAGGTLASDLGIRQPSGQGAGVPVVGGDLGAKLTDQTPLADLRNGAGLDPAGFKIAVGTKSATIGLAGLTSVQDLVNAVNTAGLGARAAISGDGTHVDLTNDVQGADLSVAEAGGQTATQLGFRTFAGTTKLADLNGGKGVSAPAGTQFTIAAASGASYPVHLAAPATVQDALAQINAATGGNVTAALATTGNGIVLTDHTTGTGTLAVTPVDAATTAADLGLTGAGATAAAGTIGGADVSAVAAGGILGDLKKLSDALKTDDTDGITDAAVSLQSDTTGVTTTRAVVGARLQQLTSRSTDTDAQNVATQSLLSSFQDVDYATATTQYQALQTSLEASLRVTASSLHMSLLDYLG